MSLLTVPDNFKCKTSSVLNKSAEYASKHMFDGTCNTCWNSDQGSPQYIFFDFLKPVILKNINIQFQGGFSCEDVIISVGNDIKALHEDIYEHIHPMNVNELQKFDVLTQEVSSTNDDDTSSGGHRYLKLIFPCSSDFYGRVTVYQLEVYGDYVDQ